MEEDKHFVSLTRYMQDIATAIAHVTLRVRHQSGYLPPIDTMLISLNSNVVAPPILAGINGVSLVVDGSNIRHNISILGTSCKGVSILMLLYHRGRPIF